MPAVQTRDFIPASSISIRDPQLRRALQRVGTGFDGARREAIEEVSSEAWEAWREEARAVKAHTLDHLDYYLEMLARNVERNGGQVHFAVDAAEANALVSGIVQARGVQVVTKG